MSQLPFLPPHTSSSLAGEADEFEGHLEVDRPQDVGDAGATANDSDYDDDEGQQHDAEPGQPQGLVGRNAVLEEGFLFVCSVILNSPAFHANMQPGDVITQFGGMNKSNFPGLKALTDQVGACNNGAVIKCIVLRRVPNIETEVYQRLECEMRVFRRPGGRGALGMVINTWPPPRPLIIESPREARGAQPASSLATAATAAAAAAATSTAVPTNVNRSGSRRGEHHSRHRSSGNGASRPPSDSRGNVSWPTESPGHHQREGIVGRGGAVHSENNRSRVRRSSTSVLPSTTISVPKRL